MGLLVSAFFVYHQSNVMVLHPNWLVKYHLLLLMLEVANILYLFIPLEAESKCNASLKVQQNKNQICVYIVRDSVCSYLCQSVI